MAEVSTMDILRIVAAVAVLVAGGVYVAYRIRKDDIPWSGNASIGLGVYLILLSPGFAWLVDMGSLKSYLPCLAFGSWSLYRGIRRKLREAKWRDGRCEACGYDLTGNVSGKCPECGTTV